MVGNCRPFSLHGWHCWFVLWLHLYDPDGIRYSRVRSHLYWFRQTLLPKQRQSRRFQRVRQTSRLLNFLINFLAFANIEQQEEEVVILY